MHPLLALTAVLLLAGLAPLLSRRMNRTAGYPLGAGLAAVTVGLALTAPRIVAGETLVASTSWVPSVGVRLTFVLDPLSLLFSLLICGVGALVFFYSARYYPPGGPIGRTYGLLMLFAASMLGLVLAGDLIVLLVCWELTSLTSFFLIGGIGRSDHVGPALRALLVTGLGGLALFAAILLLVPMGVGFDLSSVLASPELVREHALAPAFLALLLVGAFTKSAQVPFHFWLPGAMVAPTPISTYLHAATMVKAGIYLLARFSPVFAGTAAWTATLVLIGLVTAIFGAGMALKQYDLKSLLAYSTVSQLGFIIALVGVGTFEALAAAAVHTIAHAAYKATLFMVVGVIDHEAGSRDIRRLSGLRRVMPLTATITGVAALSMAGLPPLLGFVSKERAFAAMLDAGPPGWFGPAAATLAVTAAIMTFAYGARIFDGAFGGPLVQERLYEPPRPFLFPAAITALAGLGLGAFAWGLEPLVSRVAEASVGTPGTVDLSLWHGLSPELALSAATVSVGAALFLARRRIDDWTDMLRFPVSGAQGFSTIYEGVTAAGRAAARPFSATAPAVHLGWVLATVVACGYGAWSLFGSTPPGDPAAARPEDWAILALIAAAAIGAALARTRLATVALVGITGFIVAVFYVLLGAPDLAITQVLVETLTVVIVVLVFRRLPAVLRRASRGRRALAAVMGLVAGTLAAAGTYQVTGRRELSEAGAYFLEAGPAEAGGENIVNTILVDFRALDTLGEIVVLATAAIGVYAIVRLGRSPRSEERAG